MAVKISDFNGIAKASLIVLGVSLLGFFLLYYQIISSQTSNEVMMGHVNSSSIFAVSSNPDVQAVAEINVSNGKTYKVFVPGESLVKIVNNGIDRVFIKRSTVIYYQDSLKNGHLLIGGVDYRIDPKTK